MTKVIPSFEGNHPRPDSKPLLLTISKKVNMSAIFVLIGISLLVATGFLAAFLWAMRSGQYEDAYTPSVRMLYESTPPESEEE